MFNSLDAMIQWENGQLDEDETVQLFQELVDNGMHHQPFARHVWPPGTTSDKRGADPCLNSLDSSH